MSDYTAIILLTLFGFLALAAILLWPVYRFLRREEQASREFTREEFARRRRNEPAGGNGHEARKASGSAADDVTSSQRGPE